MKKAFLVFILTAVCMSSVGQKVIDLSGVWDFRIDRGDVGVAQEWFGSGADFDDSILLPGSMPQRLKGDDISVNTKWVGSLYDSSYFFNPNMERYRKPGKDMKLPFFLTPDKHYVGVAWYRRNVIIPDCASALRHGGRFVLDLERVHIESTLWVNGKRVGMCNSLVAAHRFDVTDFVHDGSNSFCIRIDNRPETVDVGQDSHSITDQTQGDWNGVVGRMELRYMPSVRISDLQVFPDVDGGKALVKLTIEGKASQRVDVRLRACAEGNAQGGGEKLYSRQAVKSFRLSSDIQQVEVVMDMGGDCPLWDEFHPNLLTLRADVLAKGKNAADSRYVKFGMRKFEIRGRMFYVNDRPVQLRGTVENCCFPLTGYAPMDVESWMKVFRRCREYGLNHMRFHSFCPPEAAFIAADSVGFYLQPEGPSWPNHGVKLGYGDFIDTYLMDETKRMVEAYGNHPSFCMLSCGNEPAGRWVEWVSKFVDYWKKTDSRRVYTGASVGGGWAWQPASQYHVKAGARGLNWTGKAPQSMDDFNQNITRYNGKDVPGGVDIREPYISHELGQWCAFPNLDDTVKFTGVNKARNYEIFADILRDNHMERLAHSFTEASGKLQALCYKYEIERTLRTKDYAGFQMLSINDYTGQGTAVVGVTDVFFDDKGYVSPQEFREFCSPIVPLARIPKFTYSNDETFRAELVLNHYGEGVLSDAIPHYVIEGKEGIIAEGNLPARTFSQGNNLEMGEVVLPLGCITDAARLTLTVTIPGTDARNHWDFWVYPAADDMAGNEGGVWVTSQFDEKTMNVLEKGGKVLISAAGNIKYGSEVAQQFTPVFWNTSWFKMRPPHTTGILVDNTHPIFDIFPTESYSELQWWELVNRAQVMLFDRFPEDFQPLVQSIDTWFLSRKVGMLFEANVLNGKVVMTTMDISGSLDRRLAARQMRRSIINYMKSDGFNPKMTLEPERIAELFSLETPEVNMFTNESPDELKPKLIGK